MRTPRRPQLLALLTLSLLPLAGIGTLAGCGSTPTPTSKAARPAPVSRPTAQNAAQPALPTPERLSQVREAAVQRIEDLSKSNDAQIRANAVEAAGGAANRLRGVIGAGLLDNNEGVRAVALMLVGRQQMTDMTGKCVPLATDPSMYVRSAAIYALNRCGRDTDRSPLADLLMTGTNINLRGHAAFLLGELGDRSAVPLLKDAARQSLPLASASERNKLQLQIAEAMVKLGETGYIEGVRAALFPATPEELESAALAVQVLGELRDRGSISQLISMSEYRNRQGQTYPAEVRLGIAGSLAKMGETRGGFIADEYRMNPTPAVRAQAAITYGLTGRSEHLEKLVLLLEDPEPLVQVHAGAAILKVYATTMGEPR